VELIYPQSTQPEDI
jgi:hypothetical protein